MAKARHGDNVEGKSRQCNDCLRIRETQDAEMMRRDAEQVLKKTKDDEGHLHRGAVRYIIEMRPLAMVLTC